MIFSRCKPEWEVDRQMGVDSCRLHFFHDGERLFDRSWIDLAVFVEHSSMSANEVHAIFGEQPCRMAQCIATSLLMRWTIHRPKAHGLTVGTVDEMTVSHLNETVF